MKIRKMQLDDLPQVAAIEQSLFGDAWSEKAFRDTLEQEEADFIVAVNAQNEIIGYCVLTGRWMKRKLSMWLSKRIIRITDMVLKWCRP